MPSTREIPESEIYALYDELDRLEELLEDMAALGIQSVDQAEARIAELNGRIDALETEPDGS